MPSVTGGDPVGTHLHGTGDTKTQERENVRVSNTVPHSSVETVNQHSAYASPKHVCLFACLFVFKK